MSSSQRAGTDGAGRRALAWIAGLAFLLSAWGAGAGDVYVRAGAEDGDGSKEKPLGLLWKAVDKATKGDVIHVAEGTYNGKGGCGHWKVSVPNLTIAGGYSKDFSARNPFKNLTVLERAADFKGDWTGLPEGLIAGDQHADHSGLIVDGLVLNAQSRNVYKADGDIDFKGSFGGKAVEANNPNLKVRNCIILNPLGEGLYAAWQGKENEVTNCFIVNTFYNGVATRSAQEGAVVLLRNNTLVFCWFYPSKGGGMSVFVGRQGKTILENNVFAFNQTEGDEAGFGVCNTMGNSDTVLKGNVFYQCQGGYYKYMDDKKASLIAWKPGDLKDLNKDPESYTLAKSSGDNADTDPQFAPEKDFFEKFSNFVASKPGKLNMDMMNEWRRSVGLPLQAEPGSKRKNYGMAYPLASVVPGLVSKLPGKGVQVDGPFAEYKGAAPAAKKTYADTPFDSFKKGTAGVKELAGKAVSLRAGQGAVKTDYLLKDAPRDRFVCYALNAPGEAEMTTKYVFGYFEKGSAAHKAWEKCLKKKAQYAKEGLVIKGTASYIGKDTYGYPVGVIVDEVGEE